MLDKSKLLAHLRLLLDTRITELKAAIALLKESRDNESKSSAGDKYETGRAMVQIELDKLQQTLQNQLELHAELLKIQPEKTVEKIGFGSLVQCTTGTYFISIGLGKIELKNETCYAISLASPIGQALKGAAKGDEISFNGNIIRILNVD